MSEPSHTDGQINDWIDGYTATATRWAELREDSKAANRVFEENHGLYKLLRGSEEGRSAIAHLMGHPSVGVQLLAATHSLGWKPERATAILREIESRDELYAVDAKWTLRSYDAGTLDLDW